MLPLLLLRRVLAPEHLGKERHGDDSGRASGRIADVVSEQGVVSKCSRVAPTRDSGRMCKTTTFAVPFTLQVQSQNVVLCDKV